MLPPNESFYGALQKKGVSRRRFIKFCTAMTATLALPPRYVAQVASALEKTRKPVLVWLQFQDCAGNSESILRSSHPRCWRWCWTCFRGSTTKSSWPAPGTRLRRRSIAWSKEEKGKYLAVVEGRFPWPTTECTARSRERPRCRIAKDVCSNAAATIAAGACALDGGLVAAAPNPTGAVGIRGGAGGQGHQPGRMPAESGEHGGGAGALPDVQRVAGGGSIQPAAVCLWADHPRSVRAARALRCRTLRAGVGRRRPSQGLVPLQDGLQGSAGDVQLPVGALERRYELAGQGRARLHRLRCVQLLGHRSPFYDRLPNVPGFGVDVTAGQIGVGITAAVAGATVVHGIASAIRDRMRTVPGSSNKS